MRSTRALRFNPTAATSFAFHQLATAIASPATTVFRVYMYFSTLPNGDCVLVATAGPGTAGAVQFESSDNSLRAGGSAAGTSAASGIVITTGVWYLVEMKVTNGATTTVDLRVDGVAATQYSVAGSAGTCTQLQFGAFGAPVTCDYYMDDIIASGTSGDYPIGAGTVAGLYPVSDGSHNYSATTDFNKNGDSHTALAAAASETTSWQSLQNPLSTTIDTTHYITGVTGATTEYLRWNADDLPANAATVNGVAAVSTHHAVAATANAQSMKVIDVSAAPAPEITVLGTFSGSPANTAATGVDLSETTIITVYKVAATGETTGAWTVANVNDLGWHWSNTDVNPDTVIDGVCLEVDYVPFPEQLQRVDNFRQLLAH